MNNLIQVRDKTRRGKNIIKIHGDTWIIIRAQMNVLFSDMSGTWFLIVSAKDDDVRWIHEKNDENFEILQSWSE